MNYLDNLQVDDQLLFEHTTKLSSYDFESEIDVNILGHIFENSLNEIEEIENTISEESTSLLGRPGGDSKRKKDGVFYTPKYITKYIVENTIGKLCEEKKREFEINDEIYAQAQKRSKKRLGNLQQYRDWLLQLSICDPACGSGAFLNQALEFLMEEHRYLDELSAKYNNDPLILSDVENSILENNLYGVDINEESVHIAKLSLWLRTAQRNRKLNDLNQNIKCGNSLIDDPEVAGKKAFDWGKEFPQIFREKNKMAFHITTAIHDSRTSERMVKYKVREKRFMGTKPFLEVIPFTEEEELLVVKIVGEIVKEDNLNLMALNICRDHMHLLLVCEETKVPKIMQKIKAKTARAVNIVRSAAETTRQHAALSKPKMPPVWTQKFGCKPITSEQQLQNTEKYIRNNRIKHNLPPLPTPQQQCSMLHCSTYKEAFRPEYTGGFDVVIGNPPYVQSHAMDEPTKNYFYSEYTCAEYQINLYAIFVEKITRILNNQSVYSIIIPNYWMSTKYDSKLRELIFLKNHCVELLNVFRVFEDATVDTVILTGRKTNLEKYPKITKVLSLDSKLPKIIDRLSAIGNKEWYLKKEVQFKTKTDDTLISFEKTFELKGDKTLGDYFHFKKGMQPYEKGKGQPEQTREMMNDRIYNSSTQLDSTYKILLKARNVQRFLQNGTSGYIKYGTNLAAPRDPEIFKGPRILINRILSKKTIDGFYTEEDYINNSDVFNLIPKNGKTNSKALSAFIMSPLCATYFRKKNVNLNRAAFPKINVNTLEKFPVPKLSKEIEKTLEQFIDLISQQLLNLEKHTTKFTTYFSGQYNLRKLPRKLENWHELEFSDFIKELNKAIKTTNKLRVAEDLTPVPELTKKDEFEWMELFEENKKKAQEFQTQITTTEKEIDQMVYELYGLTEEEIAIVENS